MTSPDVHLAPGPLRVHPYAMTGGRTRPTPRRLEIETRISTTSVGEHIPKLTAVEQPAIAAL